MPLAPFAALLLVCAVAWPAAAVTTKVLAQTEECFHEDVRPGGQVNLAFAVTHGGKLDIDAYAEAYYVPEGKTAADVVTNKLQEWTLVSEGHIEWTAPMSGSALPARLKLCLSNKMARWTPKWVNFEFYKMEAAKTSNEPDGDDGTTGRANAHFNKMETILHEYATKVFDVRSKLQKVREVERHHRDTVESTNSWLFYGALVNGLLLVLMAIFQFWYLKQFLSVRAVMRI